MNVGDQLRDRAWDFHERLFRDVTRLRLVDFPDHPNVGDSAIALGELAFFRASSRAVESVHCIGSFNRMLLDGGSPVVIHGGGNIAGFFDGIDEHRNRFGRELASDTLLIQAPQSVHFVSENARRRFENDFLSRRNLRIAVRDSTAMALLSGIGATPELVPDAAHLLGAIAAPDPERRHVVLQRTDQESATSSFAREGAFDWPADRGASRVATWFRWKIRYGGVAARSLNPSPATWEAIARARLQRGIDLLAPGEIVVTDRLHAMILGLQMGRRVFAIDNANKKLSKYADTWFDDSMPIDFFPDFERAIEAAR